MKKILLIFILITKLLVFSQKVEFGLQTSYALATSNSILGQQQKKIYDTEFSISNIRGGFGTGANFNFHTNLKIHEFVKLQLAYDFLFKNDILLERYDLNDTLYQLNSSSSQQRFIPGFLFHFPMKKIEFYFKSALVLPTNTATVFSQIQKNGTEASTIEIQKEFSYAYSFGYKNSIGASIDLNKSFSISFFLESFILNLKTKSSEMVKYNLDEMNLIETLSFYEKNSIYSENLNNFSNNEKYNSLYSTSRAKEELTTSHNFSNLAFGLSFVYKFKEKSVN